MAIWQSGITKYVLVIWLCRITKCSLAILQQPIAKYMLAILATPYRLNGNDRASRTRRQKQCFYHVSLILVATFIFYRVAYQIDIFQSVSVGISWYLPYQYRRKSWSILLVSYVQKVHIYSK